MFSAIKGAFLQPGLTLGAVPVEVWAYGAIGGAALAAIAYTLVCYKRCPAHKILVVYGKVGNDRGYKCLLGGGVLVTPLVQDYAYISLEPYVLPAHRVTFMTRDGVDVVFHGTFTAMVSTDPALMTNAVERLLNMPEALIHEQLEQVLLAQLEAVFTGLDADEVDTRRELFTRALAEGVESGLNKLGVALVNFSINWVQPRPT